MTRKPVRFRPLSGHSGASANRRSPRPCSNSPLLVPWRLCPARGVIRFSTCSPERHAWPFEAAPSRATSTSTRKYLLNSEYIGCIGRAAPLGITSRLVARPGGPDMSGPAGIGAALQLALQQLLEGAAACGRVRTPRPLLLLPGLGPVAGQTFEALGGQPRCPLSWPFTRKPFGNGGS